MKKLIHITLSGLLIIIFSCNKNKPEPAPEPQQLQDTIPNYDFENWVINIWGHDFPVGWTTNTGFQISQWETRRDSNAYHGNYAALLHNAVAFRAQAETRFPVKNHPLNLQAFVKCNLVDSDTVSIEIKLLNNSIAIDSGVWLGTSSINVYTQINIPISQNATLIDSALIIIKGGNHLNQNQLGEGTEFWVDYLSLINSQ